MKILNLSLGMSYNIPKMLCSKFQIYSIKIEHYKINPISPFNPISAKDGSEHFKPITRYVLSYAQGFMFQISKSLHYN